MSVTLKKKHLALFKGKVSQRKAGWGCSSGKLGLIPIFLVEEGSEAWAGVPAS